MMCEHEFDAVREMAIEYIKAGETMPTSPSSVLNLIDDYNELRKQLAAAIASAPTDIAWLLELVEQQQQQIEQLKCCGNCKNQCVNDKCYASKTTDMNHLVWVDACRLHKCDKWQGVE